MNRFKDKINHREHKEDTDNREKYVQTVVTAGQESVVLGKKNRISRYKIIYHSPI
jgi:hypothetical protein